MSPLTREAVLELLHAAGSHTIFYRWLFHTERLSGEFERLAHQVLGTRVWNTVFQRTGQSPVTLSLEEIQNHLPYVSADLELSRLQWAVAPPFSSAWDEFVLDKAHYEAAVDQMDELIAQTLLRSVDQAIFKREHRFQ